MKHRLLLSLLVVSFTICLLSGLSLAGDLDDGISKYTDDGISKYDNLGQPDKNIKYIITRAKAKAAMGEKKGSSSADGTSDTSTGNMNSVVMGPGGNIRGDIIIIDQSKGDKTQVVQ